MEGWFTKFQLQARQLPKIYSFFLLIVIPKKKFEMINKVLCCHVGYWSFDTLYHGICLFNHLTVDGCKLGVFWHIVTNTAGYKINTVKGNILLLMIALTCMVTPVEPIDNKPALLEKGWLSVQHIIVQVARIIIYNCTRSYNNSKFINKYLISTAV